jgi:hypothetical protein
MGDNSEVTFVGLRLGNRMPSFFVGIRYFGLGLSYLSSPSYPLLHNVLQMTCRLGLGI